MRNTSQPIRWGILGAGHIARKLVTSIRSTDGCEIVAASSRTPGKAEAFACEWGIPVHTDDYGQLVERTDIDVVYVATTHNLHMEAALLALKAGKAVLCEKPLALSASQAKTMAQAARESGAFLMEAMWTRFLPAHAQARQWMAEGRIGRIKQIHSSFGFDGQHVQRLIDPDLAGGALLDLGIYPLSFASGIMGGQKPARIQSMVEMTSTGVDGSSMIQYDYGEGVFADLKCSILNRLSNEGWILGTKGRIHFPADCHSAQVVRLLTDSGAEEVSFREDDSITFKYQVEEVNRCLRDGLGESPVMPVDESIRIAETMDALREEWGLRYPGE